MKRKVWQTILIAALLLALLAATALAISALTRSAESEQLTRARQALQESYGLTPETIGLFWYERTEGQDGAVSYAFFTTDDNADQIGRYTITFAPNAAPAATWSHDGADPALWQDGSPDAPVWGQPQLLRFLTDQAAQNQAIAELNWDESTPEERAAAMPTILLYDGQGDAAHVDRVAPGPEDLSPEEAQALAAQALHDTYGIPEADIATFRSQADLAAPQDAPRQYRVDFENGRIPGAFIVQLDAATGAPTFTDWWTEPWDRTLPDGPLDGYEQAVTEFLDEGALPYQNAAEKADILARVQAAGFSALLPADTPPYVAPGPSDLPEADALAQARQALLAAYPDFTPELLDAFYPAPRTSLVEDAAGRRWEIAYPTTLGRDREFGDLAAKLGEYNVLLDARDGTVLEVSWSQDAAGSAGTPGQTYTRETLADAPAYGPAELALLLLIQQDMDALTARNPTYEESWIYDFSLADVAEYHRLTREAGCPRMDTRRIPAVPGPEHLSQEEALALAKQALREDIGISEAALDAAEPQVEFILEEGRAQWEFFIVVYEDGLDQGCFVALDAETGEILTTDALTGGNG